MAQSDFAFVGSAALVGGVEGTGALHSLLASPLTTEGTYCRSFVNSTSGIVAAAARVKAASFAGALVGVPNTKSISVRAWLRAVDGGTVGVSCKASTAAPGLSTTGCATGFGPGYHLVRCQLGDNGLNGLYCACVGTAGNTSDTIIGTVGSVWTKVRMDVIPINGNEGDKIMIYTGTGATGSETWTLLLTRTVLSGQAGYIAWNHATNKHTGFGYVSGGSAEFAYIDRFQALLVNA